MNRRIFLGAGWKMNKTVREAQAYAQRLLPLLDGIDGLDDVQLFVVPPFTAIEAVKRLSAGRFWVGGQNMHWEDSGAFTGEISAPMLCELGADLVELGHAERRHLFNETDETVRRKVRAALRHGLRPLVCVGEQLHDREAGKEKATITRQLTAALGDVPADRAPILREPMLMVAYEPVWAIGEDGAAASLADVRAMNAHIRWLLEDIFGAEASSIPVLYGGTVDVDNCAGFLTEGGVDGLFVGRAAWSAEGFARLIECCAAAIHNQSVTQVSGSRPC